MFCGGKHISSQTFSLSLLTILAPVGITTYNPVKVGGAGPGKNVAIVGIGGLGHLGLQVSCSEDC